MKKLIFTFFTMLLISMNSFSQLETFILDDFENGQVNFSAEINVNPAASMDIAVVDNPVKDAVNGSNKVWEWKRYDTGDNQKWAGFWAILTNEIPNGYHRVEIKFLRTNSTSQLRLKCEGAVTKEMDPLTPASKTNQWETLVFDIHANEIKNVRVIGLFPDYYEPIDINAKTYIDDIKFVYDSSIVPPTPATTDTLFHDSKDNQFYDQSWSPKATAPSTLVLENWQAGQPDGDKFPVVTTPVKDGANAIKLQWKSAPGGAWSILLASIDWKLHDLTKMTDLKFWVNSPVALSKSNLPKIFMEAGSGNPNKTGAVSLSAYAPDLKANTWTEITVPLADLWAADPTFTAKDLIKGVFFEQDAADNVEHTLYMDEFIFSMPPPPVTGVLFHDSKDNRFHDQSWSPKATSPSTLVLENWQAGQPDGDKFPVVTNPVKDGANALKLQWKSVAGGSWSILLANNDWLHFDLTDFTSLKFWVNSPVALSKANLPKIFMEAHAGNPNKTGSISLSQYADDIPANTWTEITVPLSALWDANPAFTAKNDIKGIFFEQDATDNVEHTLYMDEFIFEKVSTSLKTVKKSEHISAYYSNGELNVINYTGAIRVFDLTGKMLLNEKMKEGKVNIALQKGIYIINTTIGNTKIAVR